MRVRLIRRDTIEEFAEDHANSRKHLDNWLFVIKYAGWDEPNDITVSLASNLIGNNRVVFDIGGNGRNAFRIICGYKFNCAYKNNVKKVHLYVNWIGTHEEYNSLTETDKLTISDY